MKFYLLLMTALLTAAACSDDSSDTNDSAQTDIYLDQVKYVLQEVRSIEKEIALAVPADSVTADVIAPLVEQRFRPKLADLSKQADALQPSNPDLQLIFTHFGVERVKVMRPVFAQIVWDLNIRVPSADGCDYKTLRYIRRSPCVPEYGLHTTGHRPPRF